MQSKKVFVLGVGAQKAGTSWFHHQLASRADTDFGFLKEYHIFDALFHSEYECFKPKKFAPWKWRTWKRNRFIKNPERYFNYFTERLKHKDILLTGDITPSYAYLTPSTYQLIRSEFEKKKYLDSGSIPNARPHRTLSLPTANAVTKNGKTKTRT